MAAAETPDMPDCDDAGSESEGDVPLLWVLKSTLEDVTKAVEEKKDVSKEQIDELIDPDEVADLALLVPLDMSEADIADLDDLVAAKGANEVAKLLVNARKLFAANLEAMSAEDAQSVPQELTGGEYKEMMEAEMAAAAAENEESEEANDEDAGDEEVEAESEPPAKKQKPN